MSITTTARQTGWVPDVGTFGARLALIRQHMGWGNVAKAAKACGVPVDSWRNWERDGREPHRMTLIAKQIAGVTGCSYEWLVLGPDRGQGGEGGTTNLGYDPLAERLIPRGKPVNRRPKGRPSRAPQQPASPERPRQRRPQPFASPNRRERVAA